MIVASPGFNQRFPGGGDQLNQAASVIRAGGIIAYPTESCFGLGCDPLNIDAIERILKLKQRPRKKGLIVIADRLDRLQQFLLPLSQEQLSRVLESWPGPFSWICPAAPEASPWLRGDHYGLAVRVTAHPLASELCETAQTALVSTSANVADRPSLKTADGVREEFGSAINFIVDGQIGEDDRPSTITDLLSGEVFR